MNINSESTLRFPVQFSPENREVYLEGEAFLILFERINLHL